MAAPVESKSSYLPCDDFMKFQDALKNLRIMDDRIIHALNKNLPTQSFQGSVNVASNCRQIYDDIQTSYSQREKSIQHCIRLVSEDVKKLNDKRQQDPDNLNVIKGLRREQTKLRLMQQEMNVEEVVKDRTLKVFYERCRHVFTPPSAPIVI